MPDTLYLAYLALPAAAAGQVALGADGSLARRRSRTCPCWPGFLPDEHLSPVWRPICGRACARAPVRKD